MNTKLIIGTFLIALFIGSVGLTSAIHNTEFPDNGCTTADNTLTVVITEYKFTVNGIENPHITVPKNSCLKIVSTNDGSIEHDFTFATALANGTEQEIWHMDTPIGETINHMWQMPNEDLVDRQYNCEIEGHLDLGMVGSVTIGGEFSVSDTESDDDDGFLPGFELPMVILGLFAILAVPLLRRRN